MAYNDRAISHIQMLIDNKNWTAAYNALIAYIEAEGETTWAKGQLALVKEYVK